MWSRKKKDRRVFAWVSDTHAGKKTGLLNPATVLLRVHDKGREEKWKPELSATQRWLWPVYENAIGELAEYAKDGHKKEYRAGDERRPMVFETPPHQLPLGG